MEKENSYAKVACPCFCPCVFLSPLYLADDFLGLPGSTLALFDELALLPILWKN